MYPDLKRSGRILAFRNHLMKAVNRIGDVFQGTRPAGLLFSLLPGIHARATTTKTASNSGKNHSPDGRGMAFNSLLMIAGVQKVREGFERHP